MKKLIKLDFNNTTRERKTEDSYSELYSYDKNNGSFEFEILNDTLTTEQVIALFKFTESNKIWKTTGTVEGNKVKVTFDTSLITQNETVICYLYFDEEQRTSDTFRFKFKVKVSEIDKMNRYEVKERFINNTVIVDRLDVVTKTELQEALKNVGGIATEGLLTEVKAEELYVKKSEAVNNTNFELVKNRVLALELKTDKDTVYDDSEVKERLTTLENKAPVDLSGYATKEELQEVRNSQPTVDTSHLVTKQELEEKQYLTTHQDLSEYAKKSELYNDSDLKARVEVLEQKTDKDTVYDDTPLKERVTALESKAIEGGAYDDKPIRDRLDVLEAKHDNDTIYDDTEVKHRLTELENKPAVDTSVFVTDEKLASKGYLTQHQDLTPYALKSEIPQPYNDTPLNERITALENKPTTGGSVDTSNLATKQELAKAVTKEELEAKHYVTEEELNNKGYLTQHQRLDNVVTKEELNSKGYITDISNLVTKEELESKNYLTTPYNDTPLKERVEVLENKVDKDTIYNDTELRNRVEVLENKPNVDLSNYVTNEQLENKHYLTQHQELSHLATTSDLEVLRNISVNKAELSKKLDTTEFNSFKDNVVTKTELAEKGYISDLSNYVTKQELHETTEIDYSNIVTTDELEAYAKKSELPTPYNDSALVSRVSALESKQDNDTVYNDTEVKQRLTALENKPSNQWEIHGTGMPNGVVEAPIGTTYVDKNKTNGALKWIKTTDGGNTGWKVFTGDTGWQTLPLINKRGNAKLQIRRINDEIIVKFDGLSWGWFGVDDLSKQGGNIVDKTIAGKQYTWIKLNVGRGNDVLPEGFRSAASLLSGLYGDLGDLLGSVYVGGTSDSNAIQLRYAMTRNELNSNILSQIRISPITFVTDDGWPTKLP